MIPKQQRLILDQVNRHLLPFGQAANTDIPTEGWVKTIRTAINMSLVQLAKRMGIKPPSLKNFESREKAGTITLKSLRDIAEAMDMKLVYAIVPKEGTLVEMVDHKAKEKAIEIVNRTSATMELEDQATAEGRLRTAVFEKHAELKNEMPKFLWD